MRSGRRVVVVGIGAVSAAGIGAERLWAAARDGQSCIRQPVFPRPHKGRIRIAAQVLDFDATQFLDKTTLAFCDPVTKYLLVAADEAVAQAGLSKSEPMGARTGTIIGTGIGGMTSLEDGLYHSLVESGRPDPLTIPRLIASSCPSNLSIRFGTHGASFAIASACSSATQAIGIATHMIRAGLLDRAITGGTEDCITSSSMLAWEALRVLTPDACRPFSDGRNGMVLGAGAGVFVLEAEETARARGAPILAEIAGYGTSSDAKDQVRPDAAGAAASMRAALEDADAHVDEVDYINAHGTGTTVNDLTESDAIGRVFGSRGPHVPMSSTKPIHGHGLGAGGALELIVTLGALRDNIAPPTINWRGPDVKCPVDPIPNEARPIPIRTAMSNSFAFGGINATLVVRDLAG